MHVQVALGVATLLTYVRPDMGSSHQANALALFTVALALLHSLRGLPGASQPSPLSRLAGPAAALAVAGVAVGVSTVQ